MATKTAALYCVGQLGKTWGRRQAGVVKDDPLVKLHASETITDPAHVHTPW